MCYTVHKKKYLSNLVNEVQKAFSSKGIMATLPVHMTDLFLGRQWKVLGRRLGNWLLEGKKIRDAKWLVVCFSQVVLIMSWQ